ncbi:MAG: histidinol-phosphate transaminase [Candidatus Omnitrophota bacterium]
MGKIWKKALDGITPYKPGKPIEEVERELGLKNVIKLASNENAMGPSPGAVEAIRTGAKNVARYPEGGCFGLRKALSGKLGISGENIVFGNGSDEIIILALRAFLNPGEEVIIADPTFAVYRIASAIEGGVVRSAGRREAYRYDVDAILGMVTSGTKIIFLANPDNPTGSYMGAGDMEKLVNKIPPDVLLFLDEAYYEYAAGGDYPETLGLIERKDRNVIIARTFSKAYALAGLRVGYGIARKDIAQVLNKVREPFNVNSLAQAAAIAALKDTAHLNAALDLVRREKKRFYERFDSLGIGYVPSSTNFILLDTGRDSKKVFEYLLHRGVVVREMSAWRLDGFIRVTIGLEKENDVFFEAFAEAMREIPKKSRGAPECAP